MLGSLLVLVFLLAAYFCWLYLRQLKRSAEYLERAQLVQQEKQIVADFMHGMAVALSEELSKEELYQRIAHASVVATRAMSACVFEVTERETLRSVAVEGLFPPHRPLPDEVRSQLSTRVRYIEKAMSSEEFPISEGVAGQAARSRESIRIEDCRTDERVVKHDDTALRVRTLICSPILFRDKTLGVLCVVNTADGLPFTETDESVVQSLAEQAGIAINNNDFLSLLAERKQIDVDLALARNIQLMLLPQALPKMEGLDIDARYVSSHSIGGDLYDVIRLGDRKIGIAVADVSGKGIPASIVMAICRTNLHRVAQRESSPARALCEVNAAIADEVKPGMYITVLYAVIDLERDTITYARAGHERPLLCGMDPAKSVPIARFPESDGFPVGMVDSDSFDAFIQEKELSFREGDVFTVYTDGVVETANAGGKEFSNSRLADCVRNNRTMTAAGINSQLMSALEAFSGKTRYDDDITMVTVRRIGVA